MFKYLVVIVAVIACAAAAPGYLGGYGYDSGSLLGHTGSGLSLGHSISYAAPALALPAHTITKIAAPTYSYAAPITKIAAPAIAPLSLGYKSYAAPAISYSAPISKLAVAPAYGYDGLGHGW